MTRHAQAAVVLLLTTALAAVLALLAAGRVRDALLLGLVLLAAAVWFGRDDGERGRL